VLLITQAILVLQPTTTPKQKTDGTHIHFVLNLMGIMALIAGLIIIEMNKASHPETRFQSVHGIFGLITFILIIMQALVGIAQFYLPKAVLGGVDNGKKLYKYHRMSGYFILIMSLVTVCAAVKTDFNKNVLHIRLWAVTVASVLVVAGVFPRIKKHKSWRRSCHAISPRSGCLSSMSVDWSRRRVDCHEWERCDVSD
jgi:hypothetical protein